MPMNGQTNLAQIAQEAAGAPAKGALEWGAPSAPPYKLAAEPSFATNGVDTRPQKEAVFVEITVKK